ncbi:MAG: TIGR04206 family protein [Haloarculaceae archaeon]
MWVKSEYAGEVAVLSTWLCALLPWSVSVFRESFGSAGTVNAVWLRFLPGRFLYVFGAIERSGSPWNWVWEVPGFVASRGETIAGYVWAVGTVVFLLALALSIAYYLDEARVESWRFDPVRTLGGLLVASGALLLVASGLLFAEQSGTTVPVGTVVQLGLGAALLRAERA